MNTPPRTCVSCGAALREQDLFCTNCGSRQPPASQGYAPPAVPQQPAYPPQPYPPQWPQSNPSPLRQPGYPAPYQTGYAAPPPAQKKRNTGLVITLCAVGMLVLAAALFFFWYTSSGANNKTGYKLLLTTICTAQTPADVAQHHSKLDAFHKEHPQLVDNDLLLLVAACQEYLNAPENQAKYTSMLSVLDGLRSSSTAQIASCANTLHPLVIADQKNYQNNITAPSSLFPNVQDAMDNGHPPFEILNAGTSSFTTINDVPSYSFSARNLVQSNIVYFEVFAFCYNEDARPSPGQNHVSWEWNTSGRVNIPPGETITPEQLGYWPLENCTDAKLVLPYISYIEYADGTTWGVTNSTREITPQMLDAAIGIQEYFDSIAPHAS